MCTSCASPDAAPPGYPESSWTCSQGYVATIDGCVPIDPEKAYDVCPAGSHWDNALQNCRNSLTNQPASPCPPGFQGHYSPGGHRCWEEPYPEVINCQTFPVQFGVCLELAKLPIKVVPFCQNSGAKRGGANITFPAGSSLSVDIKSNRLDGCTAGGTQADGTQLLTCWGEAGMTFSVQLCTDPATCTTYEEALGTCAANKDREPGEGPAPIPPCVRC